MTATLPTTAADPPPVGDAPPGIGAPGSLRRPAAETVRLYAVDWNVFLAWCKGEDLAPLPAAPALLAAFLNAGVATLSAEALARRARASIRFAAFGVGMKMRAGSTAGAGGRMRAVVIGPTSFWRTGPIRHRCRIVHMPWSAGH